MGHRPNCRSCRHCTPPSSAHLGWCQLRQLQIHPELAGDLWCHHWTARPPQLPLVPAPAGPCGCDVPGSQQLSLAALDSDF